MVAIADRGVSIVDGTVSDGDGTVSIVDGTVSDGAGEITDLPSPPLSPSLGALPLSHAIGEGLGVRTANIPTASSQPIAQRIVRAYIGLLHLASARGERFLSAGGRHLPVYRAPQSVRTIEAQNRLKSALRLGICERLRDCVEDASIDERI
jgi:hypothetical protein